MCLDFLREMRKRSPGLIIMLSPGRGKVGQQFPAVARWVQEQGRIEVGQQKDAGFVVRALDDGGLVFENKGSKTLAEAMAALEEGLAERFKDQEAALGSSSPKVEKRQRRLHHDA